MYVQADVAMRKRRMLESPSCAVDVLQQPNLGGLGQTVVNTTPALVAAPGGTNWMLYAAAGLLAFAAFLWWRNSSSSSPMLVAPVRRRRRTKRIPMLNAALYAAGAGAGGYLLGKYTS
jgi:hypothetical protein